MEGIFFSITSRMRGKILNQVFFKMWIMWRAWISVGIVQDIAVIFKEL